MASSIDADKMWAFFRVGEARAARAQAVRAWLTQQRALPGSGSANTSDTASAALCTRPRKASGTRSANVAVKQQPPNQRRIPQRSDASGSRPRFAPRIHQRPLTQCIVATKLRHSAHALGGERLCLARLQGHLDLVTRQFGPLLLVHRLAQHTNGLGTPLSGQAST